ncbi:MAG: DNA translocase FtsK 4TM domain-containing protein [Neisseria sp.]|nr:DNA translocase FtsK 4TM domain-containing protein [Neisseria sp.]
MTRKKTVRSVKPKQPVVKNGTSPSPIFSALLGDALWLVTLLAVGYVALSLLSFTMGDPAWSRSTAAVEQTRNLGGIIGAYLSDIAYYAGGVSVWWLVIAALVWLVKSFRGNAAPRQSVPYRKGWGVFGVVLLLCASSVLEYALWHGAWRDALPLDAGGLLGLTLAPPFAALFGLSGSLLLSLVVLLVGLSLLLQVSWLVLIEKIGLQLEWLWLKLIRKPHEFIAELPRERTSRRMVRKAQDITRKPLDKGDVPVRSNRASEKLPAMPPAPPLQEDLPFDEEPLAAGGKKSKKKSTWLPALDLLGSVPQQSIHIDPEFLQSNAERIEAKLSEFGIDTKVVSATAGPVITRYEIEPAQGVKGSQIVNLSKDLARSLSLHSVRVVETISGRHTMGIELPNDNRQDVVLSEVLGASVFQKSASKLTVALGKDIAGTPVVADLAKMPHLLVAGTTGSGKSVAVNAMIISMLYKATPEEVRMIMIDPKMLELSVYQDIPHLLCPVVTDMKQASQALNWCVNEMEKRYRLLSHADVRNIAGFNQKIRTAAENGNSLPNPFSLNPDEPEPLENMPYIVVIIDELADLMMVEGKKVEQQIARLAQKARAAGIHLILATQRPSVDVITGLIKANIPTRISFQVSSRIDSRTILDQMGAEHLLGKGDMLFLPPGTSEPTRLHGAFVSDAEVLNVAGYLKRHAPPQYVEGLLTGEAEAATAAALGLGGQHEDELFDQAVQFVLETRKTSISSLQRHLRIGYNRSANLMQALEDAGVVSPAEVGGSRQILARAQDD